MEGQSRVAPGCPGFGTTTVLERPQDFDRQGDVSVSPGLHVFEGSHAATWWDPQLLHVEAEEKFGLRQEDILSSEDAEIEARKGEAAKGENRC